jgi:hypothetical protein
VRRESPGPNQLDSLFRECPMNCILLTAPGNCALVSIESKKHGDVHAGCRRNGTRSIPKEDRPMRQTTHLTVTSCHPFILVSLELRGLAPLAPPRTLLKPQPNKADLPHASLTCKLYCSQSAPETPPGQHGDIQRAPSSLAIARDTSHQPRCPQFHRKSYI